MKTSYTCSACGGSIPSDAKFCPSCGAAVPLLEQVCSVCGASSPPEARFCAACGTSLQKAEVSATPVCAHEPIKEAVPPHAAYAPVQENDAPVSKKRIDLSRIRALVRGGLLLLIAAFLLITSFLPIASINATEMSGFTLDEPLSIRYSAIDLFTLAADAIKDESASELREDDLYDRVEDLQADLSDADPENLSRSDMRKIEKMLWLYVRLSLRSDQIDLAPSMIFSVLLSVIYIAFAISLFFLALTRFLRTLRGQSVDERGLVKLFFLAPFLILLLFFVTHGLPVSNVQGISVSMAWSLPALILSSVTALLFIVEPYIFREKKASPRHLISGGVCLLLSVISLCLCFGPAVKVALTGEFRGSNRTRTEEIALESEFFQEFEMSDTAADDIEDFVEEDYNTYIGYYADSLFQTSAKDFRNGAQYAMLSQCLVTTAFWWYGNGGWALFPITYYAAALAALLLMICAWRALVSLYDRPAKKSIITAALFALISTFGYLALSLVFVTEINRAFDEARLEDVFSLSNAATPIFLIACVLAVIISAALLPKGKRKNESYAFAPTYGDTHSETPQA